jgi:beta-lactamase regulating signal transducer with metallopeptidase domain
MNLATGMSWLASAFDLGLDLALKATILLGFVLIIQHALGSRRAFLGSAAANAGLIGLLLLPIGSLGLPSLSIPCLPARAVAAPTDSKLDTAAPAASARIDQFARTRGTTPIELARDNPAVDPETTVTIVLRPESAALALPHAHSPALVTAAIEPGEIRVARPQFHNADWAMISIAIYALGASILLSRIGASLGAVARLRRSCRQVDDASWTDALKRWRSRLGIRRSVVLVQTPQVSVPVALGWRKPAIVLPESLLSPSSHGPIDAVMLHELSHVGRGDYVWNVILQVVQAIYWPHVLVWVLGRAVARLRERACDELCVCELGGPAAYRDALLLVASGIVRRPSPALGLAMARSSKLGRRLAEIERSAGDRRYLAGWPATLCFGALAIATAGVIGAAQLVRAEPRANKPDDLSEAARHTPNADPAGRLFHLRVVSAATNEPVSGADVRVSMAFRDESRKTDAQGRLDIVHSTGPSDQTLTIDLWGQGRAMQRHSWDNNTNQPIPDSATIALQPGETLGGIVEDDARRPIHGAVVYLWSHNYKRKDPHELLYDLRAVSGPDGKWQTSGAPETTGELLGFKIVHPDFLSVRDYRQGATIPRIADLRAGKAMTVMKKGVPIEGRVVDADGIPVAGARVLSADDPRAFFVEIAPFAVTTDANGHFRTGQVKPGEWFLVVMAKGHAPGDQRVTIGSPIPQFEVALGRPRPFKGRVVDPDGKPIAGARFDADAWRGHRCLGTFLWTDADGRFRWDDAPIDELIVNVGAPGYTAVFQQKVTPSPEEIVFKLTPALAIQGKLSNAETKKRVENALVEYGAVDPATGEVAKWTNLEELGFGGGVYQGAFNANFPVTSGAYKLRIRSAGFHDFISRTFLREEKVVVGYDIALVPGTTAPVGRFATVLGSDGKPLAGARVVEVQAGGHLNLENGAPNLFQGRKVREDRTTADGKFAIPQYNDHWFILIMGDSSYAFCDQDSLKENPTVQAANYGKIDGQVFVGSRSVPDQELELTGVLGNRFTRGCNVFVSHKTKSDQDARFTFERVIPIGGLRVARRFPNQSKSGVWSIGDPVRVQSGTTTRIVLGGKGRPVIGRVEPPAGWTRPIDFTDRSEAHLESDRPWIPYPPSLFRRKTSLAGIDLIGWNQKWSESPEAWDYADQRVSIGVAIAPDGSFQIDDVPPGEYRLAIRVNGESRIHVTLTVRRDAGPFARVVRTFNMPPAPPARKDPLDLGVLQLQPRVTLEAGRAAPPFEVTTVDGKKLKVPGDFHGKFLLLDFGTTWDVQSRHQIPPLNDVYEKYGKDPDPRLAIVSVISAADNAEARKFIEEKGEPWPQAMIGPLSNDIASLYGIDDENVSTMTFIGPDGRIVAMGLWNEKIGEAVAKAIGPVAH